MVRTNVPISQTNLDALFADPAGTAADATNDHVITLTKPLSELLVRVVHTTASAKICTFVAGDNPPADAAGAGNLATSFANGSVTPVVRWFVLSSARFGQNDGTLSIDLEAGFTGFITAFALPAGS